MAERGAFARLARAQVARISYVGLNAAAKVETTEMTPELTGEVWEGLNRLIARYMTRVAGVRRAACGLRHARRPATMTTSPGLASGR